jgi:hypothetical protein
MKQQAGIQTPITLTKQEIKQESKQEVKKYTNNIIDISQIPLQHPPKLHKTLLYNCNIKVGTEMTNIVHIPFDGSKYKLNSVLVSVDGNCPFALGLCQRDNKTQLNECHVKNTGILTISMDKFNNIPEFLTTLDLDCFCELDEEKESYVTGVEIDMIEK